MANPVSWLIDKIKRLNYAIWNSQKNEMPRWESFVYKQLRIIVLAGRGFTNDKVQLRASALTFYSLLSIVPLVAIAFAIAKGFGLDKNLQQLLTDNFSNQPEVLDFLLKTSKSALNATRGGYIAGVGFIILFWSVLSLLENIENSFNHIWQIRIPRPWFRKFTDYFTFLLIAPIFIILSSSITVFVSTQLDKFMSEARILAFFKPIISFLFQFAPFFLSWITMTILFIIMPNTKVRLKPALISGIIAGTIQHLLQVLYVDLQFGIGKLSTIYGTFAFVPLLIVWMQATWIVVLIGAELTYANQNIKRFEMEFESTNISYYQKRALVLLIMNKIIRNFTVGERPLTEEEIALSLNIPVRLARELLLDLNSMHLVSIVGDDGSEHYYQPALDINKITVSYVFSKMDRRGGSPLRVTKNEDYEKITGLLERYDKMLAKSASNIMIKDL
ncbi:MAG TPA: YihY/virulence factor BrkB family protein [Bacteroidales bacterium]|nr:YihY/virulence factor BrkB family protein [Bacteroidales bacterium]